MAGFERHAVRADQRSWRATTAMTSAHRCTLEHLGPRFRDRHRPHAVVTVRRSSERAPASERLRIEASARGVGRLRAHRAAWADVEPDRVSPFGARSGGVVLRILTRTARPHLRPGPCHVHALNGRDHPQRTPDRGCLLQGISATETSAVGVIIQRGSDPVAQEASEPRVSRCSATAWAVRRAFPTVLGAGRRSAGAAGSPTRRFRCSRSTWNRRSFRSPRTVL